VERSHVVSEQHLWAGCVLLGARIAGRGVRARAGIAATVFMQHFYAAEAVLRGGGSLEAHFVQKI